MRHHTRVVQRMIGAIVGLALFINHPLASAQITSGRITSGTVQLDKIVIPTNAPEPVTFAASELHAYLQQSTGVDLPITVGDPVGGALFITTASLSPAAEEKTGGFTNESNRRFDRTIIAERAGCVYLVGENPRSALYAVYDFLQDRLGIRFYGTGAVNEIVPFHETLEIEPGLTLRKGSALEYRNYMSWEPPCHDFVTKNRINMIMSVEKDFGDNHKEAIKRGLMLRGPGHCWSLFLPDPELFATHPEYFPMRDGQRVVTGQGGCFSQPEVRQMFVKKVGDYLHQHQFWDVFALWAEDVSYPSYCDCPECAKRTAGEWYTLIINEVAPIVEKELPQGRFEFIAYHETRWPTKSPIPYYRNGKNMMLDLCLGYSRDLFHPLASRSGGSAEVENMWYTYFVQQGPDAIKGLVSRTDLY
ncbi:MAG: DUF4838 domain-containing protein [Pirellulaceae bacterium]